MCSNKNPMESPMENPASLNIEGLDLCDTSELIANNNLLVLDCIGSSVTSVQGMGINSGVSSL